MPDVALVTYGELPDLNPDDHPLRAELTARGAWTHAVRWDDPNVDWRRFDVVVLRSCWDYHLRTPEFRTGSRRRSAPAPGSGIPRPSCAGTSTRPTCEI